MPAVCGGQAAGKLVVVDFSASWCGPCRMMKPVLERLARRCGGAVDFLEVDCEETPQHRSLAQRRGIRGFPTFHIFYQGQLVDQARTYFVDVRQVARLLLCQAFNALSARPTWRLPPVWLEA